jgi:hypothetical protein
MTQVVRPLKISEIQIDKIIYDNTKGETDKKYVLIHYEKPGNKLIFQTPQMMCATLPIKNNGYYDFDVPLYGKCMRKVNKLIKLLQILDNKCIEDAKKNAKKWFVGKNNIRYKSLIREVSDRSRIYENGVIKVKLLDNFEKTNITQNGKDITFENILQNNHIRMILEVFALLITKDGFSLYLKPLLVDQVVIKKYQFAFNDDSDSDSILYTEIGNDENIDIDIDPKDLFIKDSESTIIQMDKKNIERKINNSIIVDTELNNGISSDNIDDTSQCADIDTIKQGNDTNDDSMYETTTMPCDYNNMTKMK